MLVKIFKYNFFIVKVYPFLIIISMVITKKEFDAIKKHKEKEVFWLEVDFGLQKVRVSRGKTQALIEGEFSLNFREKVKDNRCYLLDNQGLRDISFFSSQTNRFYKLVPTADWPTISISSVPMHRLSSPKKDTQNKISLIKPYGEVLDTCMGLGYSAILASRTAARVITFEKDENVLAIAKINPFSQELFYSQNISIRSADIFLAIRNMEEQSFDCVVHDPPTFKLAGELYSEEFYSSIMQVLKTGGKFFHYTPLYKIKQGFDFPRTVGKRLKTAGFKQISYSKEASGFLCFK